MNNFYDELKWRGFIHTATQGVEEYLRSKIITGYIGFDPSAPSLHIGSLLTIMGLVHFQRSGHVPIAIAGGGTGMIGDPSGKTQERKLLPLQEIEENLEGIKKQLSRFLDFNSKNNPAKLVNNSEWLTKISLMEFLRDVGKHFSVSEMLAKESVKIRVEQEQGISFTEFSYALLQSYDYLKLYENYRCTLQMGGSDQWGNIVSGIDLIRRKTGALTYGIVFPLITTSSGVKFGKTESGTIWLDPDRTSPYKFYQYWFNTDDRDVVKYLKLFTLLPLKEIVEYEGLLNSSAEKREAQSLLAKEVTGMLHGETALGQAVKASQIFFGGEIIDVDEKEIIDIFSDVPSTLIDKERLSGHGMPLIDLLVTALVTKSKGDARRLIQSGGIYLNNIRITDIEKKITMNDSLRGKFLVLRRGIKNYFLVKIIS